ncbi:Magnesium transporter MRS2-3 [Hibiscus syriacus]|uniref:Magnesium transporter MRS2-3 n=1 Tax=Hibiscus syriacus TaxID=106335 RepID=A0A6A3CSN8_HIBSY|nr:Magnesium transporter MRS2-3 [Hibiscus syriacus]
MRRTGLPARDLRILDPLLSYPSTILGRERAIVINLENIKAIITAQEVLLLNSKDPSVTPFVDEIQSRILCHFQATKVQEGAVDDSNYIIRSSSQNLSSRFSQPQNLDDEGKSEEKQSLENPNGSKILPFEFVALEACLEAACSCLENEVRDELEHLLDDAEDMAEMYLTEKQLLENSSTSSMNDREDMGGEVLGPDINDRW